MLIKKTKKEILQIIYHNFLIVLGSLILAFGTAMFLTKNTIVAGGLSGIAFIFEAYLGNEFSNLGTIVDIVVWIFNVGFWLLSLFTLGKTFALRTLLATLLFPAFLSLFTRVEVFDSLANTISGLDISDPSKDVEIGYLLLCGICGGISVGLGISLTFLGKGSTGGVDVLAFLINKIFGLKVSICSLSIDTTIIGIGIISLTILDSSMILNCLCGIISAIITSLVIEVMFSRKQNAFILHIISDHHQEIAQYIMEKMERGVTVIPVKGAYTKTDRIMLETVLSRNEYIEIKDVISKIDPQAFLTFTDTNAVYGEGFRENFGNSIFKKKRKNNGDLNGK